MDNNYDRVIQKCVDSEDKGLYPRNWVKPKKSGFDVFDTEVEPPRTMDLVELLERSGVSTS